MARCIAPPWQFEAKVGQDGQIMLTLTKDLDGYLQQTQVPLFRSEQARALIGVLQTAVVAAQNN